MKKNLHSAEFSEARVARMVERLKETDHRITPQRLAILEVLATSDGHPSAEDIYRQLVESYPTMSPATVYKTLSLLKSQGEILELEFSDLANRYDGKKPYPHPHVICTVCGAVVDPAFQGLEEITAQVVAETGFQIHTHRLDFFGVCPGCRRQSVVAAGSAEESSQASSSTEKSPFNHLTSHKKL